MAKAKGEIVTFKADAALLEAMRGVPNRSEFIRAAILAALDGLCRLCRGTGVLTPNQTEHWRRFVADHSVRRCEECHEMHLVCERAGGDDVPGRPEGG